MAAASAHITAPTTTCNARTRRGTLCNKTAGMGTDHLGWGRCKFHGGSGASGNIHAAKLEAAHIAERAVAASAASTAGTVAALSGSKPISLERSLQFCIDSAYATVEFWNAKIAQLEESAVLVQDTRARQTPTGTYVEKSSRSEIHMMVVARDQALERLARFTKMALDSRIDERRVQIDERQADQFAQIFQVVLAEAGVEMNDHLADVIELEMRRREITA